MYESFFQLTKPPFSLVSDPGCVHITDRVKDVLRSLIYGVLDRRGCIALIAEPGLGKTTMLRSLCELLQESNSQSSMILTPTVSPDEFLELAMLNFGIQDIPVSKARRLKILENFLAVSNEADKVCVLIIDEAHKLSNEVLEEVRLLSNFEEGNRKLLQIVLAGQNELNDRLSQPDLWQFKQRIATRVTLHRLNRETVGDYIQFRWSQAGESAFPFSETAVDAVAAWSRGVPRMINIICHNSLQIAYGESMRTLDAGVIHEACIELALPPPAMGYAKLAANQAISDPAVRVEPNPPLAEAIPGVEASDESVHKAPESWFRKLWRGGGGGADSRPSRAKTSILSLEDHAE